MIYPDYNSWTREQRADYVDSIRRDLAPDPVPLDYTTPQTYVASFIARYYFRTDLFASEQLGIVLDEWQREVALDADAGEMLISIRACHNVGKSTVIGIIALKFLLTRWRCKIVMTAPSAGQLFDALFAEVKSMLKRLPEPIQQAFNVKSDRIEMVATPEDAFLSVRTSSSDRPEAMQGVHSDFVLLLPDESAGIPNAVFDSAGGSLAGKNCTMIETSNPTRLQGHFADTHLKRGFREMYKRYHISKHPYEGPDDGCRHFVSDRITDDYENKVIAERGRDSDEYRIRVLGEFPTGDGDSFLKAERIVAAMGRDISSASDDPEIWAIDPARFGRDGSAFARRKGRRCYKLERKYQLDTMQLTGWIKHEWDATAPKDRPTEIRVDVIGIGAGVVDRLKEMSLPVRAINVSESPSTKEKFMRLRDELWGMFKDVLDFIALPNDDELLADLQTPHYDYTSDGRLKIESKESMRKRGKSSPDKADAVIMLYMDDFAVYSDGPKRRDWDKPIERNLHATV